MTSESSDKSKTGATDTSKTELSKIGAPKSEVKKIEVSKTGAAKIEAAKKEPLHPEEVVTTVFLIRHGHTRATEEGKLYTDPAAELTDSGREQARLAGLWLKEQRPDVLLSSTSKRVFTSAEIVGEILKMPLSTVPGLDEWHVGEWDGRAYVDIKAEHPELYKAWSADPIANRPPGGESIADVCKRAQTKLAEVLQEHSGKKIALITHAGIIRSFLVHALGMPIVNFWRVNVPVGTITQVDFSPSFATVQFMAYKPGN
jgi:broad specificity phosphatase PhoE